MGSPRLVVVGGGPAGAAAAAAARDAGLDVRLCSAGPPSRMRPGESLPPGCDQLLEEIFGPGGFRPEDHRPAYGNRSAWGSGDLESADFIFNPFGAGWHLDRPAFDATLVEALRRRGVHVVEETAPRRISAPFVIDATGRPARIARSRGARRRRLDRLVAVISMFRTAEESDSTTTVVAAENGWWYTTPLPGRRRIAAFLTDADLLPPPAPPPQLALSGCAQAGEPFVTDAATSHLDAIAGPGWLAVGDAAVAFDPLSSQGIVTALLMGREAGRVAAGTVPSEHYVERYDELLDEHLALRAAYYAEETRWPHSPFWARRQGSEDGTRSFASASDFAL